VKQQAIEDCDCLYRPFRIAANASATTDQLGESRNSPQHEACRPTSVGA